MLLRHLWEAASKIDPGSFEVTMNIHEHQAKQILKKYGALVPDQEFLHLL